MGRFVERRSDPSRLEIALVEGLLNGMQAWMVECAKVASQRAPVRTSRLANEIKADPQGPNEIKPMVVQGLVGVSGLEYARAQELGSGLHAQVGPRELIPIPALDNTDAKTLMFEWPEGPKPHPAYNEELGVYFFKRIWHPGVKAANEGKGYLRLAARETLDFGKRAIVLGIAARLKRENAGYGGGVELSTSL